MIGKNETIFRYENTNIDQSLIDKCEELSKKTGEIYFIFDVKTSNFIKSIGSSREDKRDLIISSIIDDNEYHIGTENDFGEIPSRFSYYDSETKLEGRYERYNYVLNFISCLGIEPNIFNYGPEFEQSFFHIKYIDSKFSKKVIIRLQPNMFIKIIIQDDDQQELGHRAHDRRVAIQQAAGDLAAGELAQGAEQANHETDQIGERGNLQGAYRTDNEIPPPTRRQKLPPAHLAPRHG